jgi:hypothetical protein
LATAIQAPRDKALAANWPATAPSGGQAINSSTPRQQPGMVQRAVRQRADLVDAQRRHGAGCRFAAAQRLHMGQRVGPAVMLGQAQQRQHVATRRRRAQHQPVQGQQVGVVPGPHFERAVADADLEDV